MQIGAIAEWHLPSDNKRGYTVAFDLDDLRSRVGNETVDNMSFAERVKALKDLSDAYVVTFVAKEGGIPQEFARQRLAELSE